MAEGALDSAGKNGFIKYEGNRRNMKGDFRAGWEDLFVFSEAAVIHKILSCFFVYIKRDLQHYVRTGVNLSGVAIVLSVGEC